VAPPAAAYEPAARLFDLYGGRLYGFCLARLRSREEAEDAVQSTFLRACRSLDRGVVPRFEAAWLYKIAHNVCLDRLEALSKQGKVVPLYDRDDLELELVAPHEPPEEIHELPAALAGLPPKLRQALLLREFKGLTYAEIAEQMETTVPAVETLLFRARREVAKMLRGDGRRRRIALLDGLAALLARFVPVAPAKLATGAALIAIGGAGLGAAVELEHGPAPAPKPHRTVPPLVAAAIERHPRATPRAAAPVHRSAPTRAAAARDAAAPGHARAVVTPDETPAAPVEEHEPQPTSAPAPAAVTTTAALLPVEVPSVTVTVPVPALPPVTVTTPQLPPELPIP
jgi:RNA polymerase sigma factor (sigma-70 family)